jgi:hypothetical protein
MQSTRYLLLITAFLLSQTAFANDPPNHGPAPIWELQAQIQALAERTELLEQNAPDASVEGRNYCFVLNLLIMKGQSTNATEELQTNVIRRSATFSGGTFTGSLLSNILNHQLDDGTVTPASGTPIDPLTATYTQTGSKVDVTFADSSTANWYVSKDGSLIHGSTIQHLVAGQGGVVTVGLLRNWTMVETDALDTCDAESQ